MGSIHLTLLDKQEETPPLPGLNKNKPAPKHQPSTTWVLTKSRAPESPTEEGKKILYGLTCDPD